MKPFKPFAGRVLPLLMLLALTLLSAQAKAGDALDLAILTVDRHVQEMLVAQLDAAKQLPASDAPVQWTTGTITHPSHAQAYRVAIGFSAQAGEAAAKTAATDALQRWLPRFLVLAGIAPSLDKGLKAGDIALARLVWHYRYEDGKLAYDQAESFRASNAIIAAATALGARPPDSGSAQQPWGTVKGGAIASGNVAEAGDERFVAAIRQRNDRTLVADRESAALAEAVATARDRGMVVDVTAAYGIGTEPVLAAKAVSGFLGALIRQRWPADSGGALAKR